MTKSRAAEERHGRRQQGRRRRRATHWTAGDAGRLHAGLRQRLRDRGAAGRAARRARTRRSAPPTASTPSSCRARPSRRRAAPTSAPGSTASARRCSTRRSSRRRRCRYWKTAPSTRRARPADRPAALGPGADPGGEAHLPHGHAHHDHRRRRQHAGRHGGARLSRHAVDGERLLLQRRRRAAGRAAAGSVALLHRVRQHRGRAGRDLHHPARRQVQGRADRRPGARLRVRELRRQVHAARPRTDRRQLPRQRARLQDAGRGLRGQGGAMPPDREMVRRLPRRRDRPLAARRGRLARQLRALQVQPAPLTRRSAPSCSTTPTRRSSRCSPRRRRRPAPPTSTS